MWKEARGRRHWPARDLGSGGFERAGGKFGGYS